MKRQKQIPRLKKSRNLLSEIILKGTIAMAVNEKKGITVKVDAALHAEVRQYLEKHEMTMADFVTQALQDELHPKLNIQEDKNMGNMRTMAFQVPEELFQKIKDYLQRNNMTQKQFVIGLIENEIERDLAQRQTAAEVTENAEEVTEKGEEYEKTSAVGDCEASPDEVEEVAEEQDTAAVSDDFDNEDADEDEELDEDQDEDEDMGMVMGGM